MPEMDHDSADSDYLDDQQDDQQEGEEEESDAEEAEQETKPSRQKRSVAKTPKVPKSATKTKLQKVCVANHLEWCIIIIISSLLSHTHTLSHTLSLSLSLSRDLSLSLSPPLSFWYALAFAFLVFGAVSRCSCPATSSLVIRVAQFLTILLVVSRPQSRLGAESQSVRGRKRRLLGVQTLRSRSRG
jgi:hypothetical protein